MPPPGVTFDSREIYLTAKAYEAAAAILSERLHAPLSKQMFRLLAIPAWYNLAFALELYLKCLHTLSSKCNPPEEHDFDVLWRNVPKDLRNRVKKAFKHSCENPRIAFILKNSPEYSILAKVLKELSSTYLAVRYTYDPRCWTGANTKIQLPLMETCTTSIRYVIEKEHSEWKSGLDSLPTFQAH